MLTVSYRVRTLVFLVPAVVVAVVVAGPTTSLKAIGCGIDYDGTTYYIDEPNDFALLGTCDPTENFVLLDDVDLSGVAITKLSNFTGVFDGHGHTITNLAVSGGGMFDVGSAGVSQNTDRNTDRSIAYRLLSTVGSIADQDR